VSHLDPRPRQRASLADANPLTKASEATYENSRSSKDEL
jgi:hypothetical protein